MHRSLLSIFVIAIALGAPRQARADIDHNTGIDMAHIGGAGNAPWAGDGTAGDMAIGRGGVNYEYNIGKFEVTTAQWVEFFNAAFDRPVNDRLPNLIPPDHWGAVGATPNTPGGQRWAVPPGREMVPVGSISWRMAAMYCNWLENNKSTARAAFLNGAYDVSTFGFQTGTLIFTDQLAHTPGARYWIPTWDEWLKASHFDPNKNGPGQAGWWRYSTTSDTAPVYGPPGMSINGHLTQANSGWDPTTFPPLSPFAVPLGAYPVTSPWGLYDTAGGTREWLETPYDGRSARLTDGSAWDDSLGGASAGDRLYFHGSDYPNISTFDYGLRIASSVPSPSTGLLTAASISLFWRRTRRGVAQGHKNSNWRVA
jgi:formylglycine-generating enzyme required for sulfatase activity